MSPLSIASMPSRRRASANFLSALTCSCTKSLKLLVLTTSRLLSPSRALALSVDVPVAVGGLDIALLAPLRAARQQNHQSFAIAPEINSIARPEIDPIFEHTFTNRFDIGEVALLELCEGPRDSGARNRFQFRKPFGERSASAG